MPYSDQYGKWIDGESTVWTTSSSLLMPDQRNLDVEAVIADRKKPLPFVVFGILPDESRRTLASSMIMEPKHYNSHQKKKREKLLAGWDVSHEIIPASKVGWNELCEWGGRWMIQHQLEAPWMEVGLKSLRDAKCDILLTTGSREGHWGYYEFTVLDNETGTAGSVFCERSPHFNKFSPGISSLFAVAQIAARIGFKYDIGIEYPYKLELATSRETLYGLNIDGGETHHLSKHFE